MSGTVVILLALHRSKGHLGDLLGSLSGQRYGDWALHAALDGEDDGTVAMVRAFADKQPQQTFLQAGPCRGIQLWSMRSGYSAARSATAPPSTRLDDG